MGLAKDLERAQARIRDLEAMLDAASGRHQDTPIYWQAWERHPDSQSGARRINMPKHGRLFVDLPRDRYGREMRLEIVPSQGPDGTRGVEIRGLSMLRVMGSVSNVVYVTEMDPRDLASEEGRG